jgi:hypothetical protein
LKIPVVYGKGYNAGGAQNVYANPGGKNNVDYLWFTQRAAAPTS